MVYLDRYIKARNEKLLKASQIVRGERRKHVVDRVMDLLDDWRSSHWELEADTRTGLRARFCLLGYGWSASDSEAAGLVTAAMVRLGAPARPAWHEGQPEYTAPRENCAWCGGGLEDWQVDRRARFCGSDCARNSIGSRLNGPGDAYKHSIVRSAYRVIQQSRTNARSCHHCGESYHPLAATSDQRYCSNRCRQGASRKIPDCQCLQCGVTFRPTKMARKFCSPKCAAVTRGKTTRIEHTCECCGSSFVARSAKAIYCSPNCKARSSWSRKKSAKIIVLRPLTSRKFDHLFMRNAA